ncbi:allene oxide synthase 1, chloroplastic-like [Andrographis paniculata]|uniref:allene oxide synthase 1, chloroplastic-like n=1 Tax=Andrographis paniculata TaxID=175694 RepID=UPI0021E7E0BF|nr:allene oxide synthase 1, chloroplastic-like [Andrographis paniculata]
MAAAAAAAAAASSPTLLYLPAATRRRLYHQPPPEKLPSYSRRRLPSSPAISAAVSEKPQSPPPSPAAELPLRRIPGDLGFPVIGPWKDRQDYFYNQGKEVFFKSRAQKYQSTVFRTNMPPGPFFTSESNVVVLLDGKSYPALFDAGKVEKKNLFTGTYAPSTDLTGGYRILSFLDPSEPSHAKLKRLMFFLLSHRRDQVVPEFRRAYAELFDSIENDVAAGKKAGFNGLNEQAAFNFLAQSFLGADPRSSRLGSDAPKLINLWVLFHLHPVLTLGLPRLLEEVVFHTFPLPPLLFRKSYQRLYDFFYQNSSRVLEEAEALGISRDEACHNLIFATCFNSFGGLKIFFPNLIKSIAGAGEKLHLELAEEVRSALKSSGGDVTAGVTETMPLVKSAVYEALRLEPPVPSQYGRAKLDFVVESHEAKFQIRKGELLYGFQPFATKDPKIFDRPEEFVPDRFVGEEGEKLLKHVLWSNGPENRSPTVDDKQCAGKDFVVLAGRLLLVEVFRRYDTFEIDVGASPLGAAVTVTSLKPASF